MSPGTHLGLTWNSQHPDRVSRGMTIQNQSPIRKEHFWPLRVIVGRFQPLHPLGQTASQNREFFTSELRIEAAK